MLSPCFALVSLVCPAGTSRSASVLLLAFAAAGTVPRGGRNSLDAHRKGRVWLPGAHAARVLARHAGTARHTMACKHPVLGLASLLLLCISYCSMCWAGHSHRGVPLAGALIGMENRRGGCPEGPLDRAHPVGCGRVWLCLLHVIPNPNGGGCQHSSSSFGGGGGRRWWLQSCDCLDRAQHTCTAGGNVCYRIDCWPETCCVPTYVRLIWLWLCGLAVCPPPPAAHQ